MNQKNSKFIPTQYGGLYAFSNQQKLKIIIKPTNVWLTYTFQRSQNACKSVSTEMIFWLFNDLQLLL